MPDKPSLLIADAILFSPLYLNTDKVSTEKLLALYRFANLFFPQMNADLIKTILDMKTHAERLSVDSSPEERRKLIGEMKGLSMDFQYALKDKGQNMMEFSVHIVPSDVLELAQQGKLDVTFPQKLSDDFDKMIIKLIVKEIRRRFIFNVMDYFQGFLKSTQVPPFISQLLEMGWINNKGQLLKDASVDELLTGKYRDQFETLMPTEILQEGMQIRENIKTCFAIGQDNEDSLIQNAKKRHALLEITIMESIKPDKQKSQTKTNQMNNQYKVSTIPCTIHQDSFRHIHEIKQQISLGTTVGIMANYAEELLEKVALLLDCQEYNNQIQHCEDCRFIAHLHNKTAELIIKAKSLQR